MIYLVYAFAVIGALCFVCIIGFLLLIIVTGLFSKPVKPVTTTTKLRELKERWNEIPQEAH